MFHTAPTAAPPEQRVSACCRVFFSAARLVLLCLCVFALFPLADAEAAILSSRYPVAMRTFGVWEAEAGERFDFSVWYPGQASQTERTREGWIVESGNRGRIIPGFYPLILLSHDTASDRFANNDMAISLASGGFLVIAPTHMGDNQSDSSALYTARLVQERPRHLVRALETVLASPDFAPYADESRIGLIGVGFGSISVLQLAGAIPDFSALEKQCDDAAQKDAFCSSWAAERLARIPKDMKRMISQEGKLAVTPPLSLYAPELMPAPPVPAPSHPPKEEKAPKEELSFFARLFSEKHDEEDPPAVEEPAAAPSAAAATAAATSPALDFQGGESFGGTDSGETFVHIALSDSPQFRVTVAEYPSGSMALPDASPNGNAASLAHRRPAGTRAILGLALVAPAGGMLFNSEALTEARVPTALIEAGQDALYPTERHAHPYYTRLPATPDLLVLPTADHFSLFARCSKETMAQLGEACGRLVGESRDSVARQRDVFLESFFRSVLGDPLPPPAPSGLVAVPSAP